MPEIRRRIRSVLGTDPHSAKDIDAARQRRAAADTAQFVDEHMDGARGWRGATPLETKLDLLRWALTQAPDEGLVLEFGVATGQTLEVLAQSVRTVHGFDSFQGLPEEWYGRYTKGHFAQTPPDVQGAELHIGWFQDTLPEFLAGHPDEPFAFVHFDADLYSSTKTIFDTAFDRFVPGTVLMFDEYFNYPGWAGHEHRAFQEFLETYRGGHRYVGYNALHEQVVAVLT